MELDEALRAYGVFAGGMIHGENLEVVGHVELLQEALLREVRLSDVGQGIQERFAEGDIRGDLFVHGRDGVLHELVLADHALLIGSRADGQTAADEKLRILAVQGHGLTFFPVRVDGGHIIIQMHGDSAEGVVQDRDGAVIHHVITVDLDALKEVLHRLDGVLGVVRRRGAEGVGQTDLEDPGADLVAEDAEDLDVGHGIAIDLQLMDLLIRLVDGQEHQEVGLAAVAVAAFHAHVGLIDTADQDRRDGGLFPPGGSIPLHGPQLAEVLAHGAALLRVMSVILPLKKNKRGYQHCQGQDSGYDRPDPDRPSASASHAFRLFSFFVCYQMGLQNYFLLYSRL